jgi:hypothetical protein
MHYTVYGLLATTRQTGRKGGNDEVEGKVVPVLLTKYHAMET